MADKQQDIRKLSLEELKAFFESNGDKAFRAKQVFEWLWNKSATSFEEMTNLSKATREMLNESFTINAIEETLSQVSNDRTVILRGDIPSPSSLVICSTDFNILL